FAPERAGEQQDAQRRSGLALALPDLAPQPFSDLVKDMPIVVPAVCGPALAMLVAGLAAGKLQISPWGLCASQYFSAGMILAVCGGLMKELAEHGLRAALVLSLGFLTGISTMKAVKRFTETFADEATSEDNSAWPGGQLKSFPWPLVAAVAIDSLVDGLLLGMLGVETPRAVPMMAGATALEMGALGLSFATALRGHGRRAHFAGVLGMPLALVFGGCLGALAAAPLRSSPLAYTFMLSFGMAALLYLVTQELLPEAEERRQEVDKHSTTPLCLFAGYLFVLIIEVAME
ncbi:unnamed protein product, partial [Polarella glacialis]